MHKIKLLDYQLNAIKTRLSYSYDSVEEELLKKYDALLLSDLNATDYDEIIDDIENWTAEINSKV